MGQDVILRGGWQPPPFQRGDGGRFAGRFHESANQPSGTLSGSREFGCCWRTGTVRGDLDHVRTGVPERPIGGVQSARRGQHAQVADLSCFGGLSLFSCCSQRSTKCVPFVTDHLMFEVST